MDEANYKFLSRLAKEDTVDFSKVVRDVVCRGPHFAGDRALQEGGLFIGKGR